MKKATNKILSFLTAFAMVIGVLVAPFASANAAISQPTGSYEDDQLVEEKLTSTEVTIHKLKADGYNFSDPLKHTGGLINQNDLASLGKSVEGLKDVQFEIYKLSDNADLNQMVENRGQYDTAAKLQNANLPSLNNEKVTVIKLDKQPAKTNDNGEAKVNLENGKYWVLETDRPADVTGGMAVPFGLTLPMMNVIDVKDAQGNITARQGTRYLKYAHVYPKNTTGTPRIDKNFLKDHGYNEVDKDGKEVGASVVGQTGSNVNDGAQYANYQAEKARITAELGSLIPYEVKTEIPQSANYRTLKWTDKMSAGLKFNQSSLVVELNGNRLPASDYVLVTYSDNEFVVTLTESGLDKVTAAAKDDTAEIRLTYNATLTDGTVVDQPQKNDIKLQYSNNPSKASEPKEGNPSNGKIEVSKKWAVDGTEVTEADRNVTATYILQVKNEDGSWSNVDQKEGNFDNEFKVTFEDLDDNKTYRVVERVKGYDPEYISNNNGVTEIRNNKNDDTPQELNPSEPEVVFGGKRFVKTDESGTPNRLKGAEFVVKNADEQYLRELSNEEITANANAATTAREALTNAVNTFNNLTAEEQNGAQGQTARTNIENAQKAYNDAVKKAGQRYEWVADKTNAKVLTSGEQGEFEITGLAYNVNNEKYALEEIKAPDGYAIHETDIEFEVKKGTYKGSSEQGIAYTPDDTENFGLKIVNRNLTIPQTGGIGSLIFYVAGAAIVVAAIVAMKRRNSVEA